MKGITSLDFLRAVYNNGELPLSVRMRAAGMAVPYEFARLQVTAFVPEGGDFAMQLEARLRRRQEMKLINAKPINEGCIEKVEEPKTEEGRVIDLTLPPPILDRRFRRRV
jgi:hypothetical protein